MGDFVSPGLLVAILIGYVFGSLPVADRLSRRYGVDIFSKGSGLAGAGNVQRTVGRRHAYVVAGGDLAKGVLTIYCARLLGVEGTWILLPALATVVGHWNSVFSGFRGGDGLSTLGGIMLALFPAFGAASLLVGGAFALAGRRIPYTSLISVAIGYSLLLTLSITYYEDQDLTLGLGALAALVLAHAMRGHIHRRRGQEWSPTEDVAPAVEEPGLEG